MLTKIKMEIIEIKCKQGQEKRNRNCCDLRTMKDNKNK